MATIDLIFEGGGAKGMVFAGALEELFKNGDHTCGRLLGTSAGAITAVGLAAGYTPNEMQAVLAEKDARGKPVFESFMGKPAPFDAEAVHRSAFRKLLAELDMPFVPEFAEKRIDDWIATHLAGNGIGRHLFSFVKRGGWYSADAFVVWLERMLDKDREDGTPRRFGKLTLREFYETTGKELTLVAADTTDARLLLLNHRTAPDCPVVWAARMSMSVPLLWQEVEWQEEWGSYCCWSAAGSCLAADSITGHAIVDGGLLSNFPIALFLSDRPDVTAVVGPAGSKSVLGLLIDEAIPVPRRSPPREEQGMAIGRLHTVQRLHRLVNTVTAAHDNMAIAVFAQHVVRLPAGGYSTTQFDMSDEEREDLVVAGRQAMCDFLAKQPIPRAVPGAIVPAPFAASDMVRSLANASASTILER